MDSVSDTERAAWRRVLGDKHLSPEDLAEREGVPLQTIYAWNKDGTAPPRIRMGRHVRYRLDDVIALENARVVPSRTA
jgi:predicted DNA-binding transcriptional regulator AlpA